jgi:SRSO17 transposase
MQHLLARAKWDADRVRDDVRGCVIEHLGDPGAVLVIDETGDVKKGTGTPGVQRQYTGTAGRIENAQVAVYLGYAAPGGHALIDRELYLPRSWTDYQGRCAAAGIPAGTRFATKPQLAERMIERTAAAAVPFAWVAGDEVYGGSGAQRAWLETRRIAYVLAVGKLTAHKPMPLTKVIRGACPGSGGTVCERLCQRRWLTGLLRPGFPGTPWPLCPLLCHQAEWCRSGLRRPWG